MFCSVWSHLVSQLQAWYAVSPWWHCGCELATLHRITTSEKDIAFMGPFKMEGTSYNKFKQRVGPMGSVTGAFLDFHDHKLMYFIFSSKVCNNIFLQRCYFEIDLKQQIIWLGNLDAGFLWAWVLLITSPFPLTSGEFFLPVKQAQAVKPTVVKTVSDSPGL